MSDPPVSVDFLQSFQIFSKFVVECVREELRVVSVNDVLLSAKELFGDFILSRFG